jgi:hypothetical protein
MIHEGTQTTGKAADAGTVIHRANKLLLKAGVEQSDLLGASYCLRAAIGRGIIPFNGTPEGLDFVITTGHCYSCDNDTLLNARIRDVLMQPDYAGTDYEAGGLRAGVQCANTSCNAGIYITGMCIGEPAFNNGKFHNHCTDCPDGGTCIYDYRNCHCIHCGEHTFQGAAGGMHRLPTLWAPSIQR